MNLKRSKFTIEVEKETDGRFIAEIIELPGVMCYGKNQQEAVAKVEALALRVVADELETMKKATELSSIIFNLV